MSDEALKPCPFCGARVATYRDEIGGYEVYCDGELGCAGDGDSRYSTEAEAIAAWNRRASDAEIERLRAALEGMNDGGCYAACEHYGFEPGHHSSACEAARAALENT